MPGRIDLPASINPVKILLKPVLPMPDRFPDA
jgi:hypothetical protein